MPLKNFGAILTFAAEMEAADQEFYRKAAANPAGANYKALLEELAEEKKKNEKLMRLTCRESVCEMILEPIVDFTREPYFSDREGVDVMSADLLFKKALQLETKAEQFYKDAAGKILALPEVSRALARTGKRRTADKERLQGISKG
jgi:rubrerythrin